MSKSEIRRRKSDRRIGALAACSVAAMAISATAQQWEAFFDSDGFEELPLGLMPSTGYESLLPHVFGGGGSGFPEQIPQVVSSPDPVIDGQSIRLEARYRRIGDAMTQVLWGHVREKLAKPAFAFPGRSGRGGYRGLRVSFDVFHRFDEKPGTVSWGIGGVRSKHGEPAAVELAWDLTPGVEAVFDEWVHVSLTYDFEGGTFRGSYAGQTAGPVVLPEPWTRMEYWYFRVSAWPGSEPGIDPDVETAWLDNLVVEVIPPCPADCDLDYAHTFFDFLCFQNMFAAGTGRADCDLDGELTVFDFLCFQNYFAHGCD